MQTPRQVGPTIQAFGPVTVEWHLPGVETPFGVPLDEDLYSDEDDRLLWVTLCPLTFRRFGIAGELVVPSRFVFDGASIPRRLWGLKGFSPGGKKLWAAVAHDWLCDETRRDRCDRVLADAVFAALLVHTGVERRRGWLMDVAVSLYRRAGQLFGRGSN